MPLALPEQFVNTRTTADVMPIPCAKVTSMWTPDQFGDDGTKSLAVRFRRWVTAWQATCLAYGLPLWSVEVPCHICGKAVNAWYSDGDHVISKDNGGQSKPDNMMLTHGKECNRTVKVERNAHARIQNVLKSNAHKVIAYRGTPNPKGGQAARTLHAFWTMYPRQSN